LNQTQHGIFTDHRGAHHGAQSEAHERVLGIEPLVAADIGAENCTARGKHLSGQGTADRHLALDPRTGQCRHRMQIGSVRLAYQDTGAFGFGEHIQEPFQDLGENFFDLDHIAEGFRDFRELPQPLDHKLPGCFLDSLGQELFDVIVYGEVLKNRRRFPLRDQGDIPSEKHLAWRGRDELQRKFPSRISSPSFSAVPV